MPYVKPLGQSAKDAARNRQEDLAITGAVAAFKQTNGVTSVDIARVLGMHPNTFCLRLQHPETFTIREMRLMRDMMTRARNPVELDWKLGAAHA